MSSESKYATTEPTPAQAAAAGQEDSAESSSASKWATASPSQQQHDDKEEEAKGSIESAIKIQPATAEEDQDESEELPPNPYLKEPLLHLSNVPMKMSDKELAQGMFGMCLPVRLKIDREAAQGAEFTHGTVEFQSLSKAELAYATISSLRLSIHSPHSGPNNQDPTPHARPRLLKQLPHSLTSASALFPLLRPFGPIHKLRLVEHNPRTGEYTGFRGQAIVDFYDEEQAGVAEKEMHCSEMDGKTISVTVDTVQRKAPLPQGVSAADHQTGAAFSPSAAPFVPGGGSRIMNASATPFSLNPRANNYSTSAVTPPIGMMNNPTIPAASGSNLQYNNEAGTYIDPCNLFVKNLSPNIQSNDLFNAFRTFGRIVSARVMRDEASGKSREFGFVSFTDPPSAAEALRSMNGSLLDGKKLTVSLHEPKRMRQEKLAAKFGGSNGNGNGASGGRRDSSAEGTQYGGQDSPSLSQELPPSSEQQQKGRHERRGSNSYFKAAMEAAARADAMGDESAGLPDYHQLMALSLTVRNEVLAGLIGRKIMQLPGFDDASSPNAQEEAGGGGSQAKQDEVQELAEQMVGKLNLQEALETLRDPYSLISQVNAVQHTRRDQLPSSSATVSSPPELANQPESRTINSGAPKPSASLLPPAPSHTIQQRDNGRASSAGADSASILSAAPASQKERARILAAVAAISPSDALIEDITDMLVGLPKKERAMCLFNQDFLKTKVEEAREILDISDGEDGEGVSSAPAAASTAPSAAAAATTSSSATTTKETPPAVVSPHYTLASLAKLPAAEIIKLANEPGSAGSLGLPLPKSDPKVIKETDEFIDGLQGKTPQDQKQKVGDILFKKVKSFGVKGAPKITIGLLDSEDLRALAHLMNSYPEVLKEKVTLSVAAPK